MSFGILLLTLLGYVGLREVRRRRLPASAVIMSPRKSTVVAHDGAVRSVQSAEFSLSEADLERLWTPRNLENLARTYWRFLSKVTLGLIRVLYGENERSVVLLFRPLTLLRFDPPEYTIEPGRGRVRWQIRDGLLVARAGRGSGYLSIDVRRQAASEDGGRGPQGHVYMEIEVANFYPAIAAELSLPAYMATQSWVHVLVTHGFLRSLARLHLAQSRIGSLTDAVVGAVSARDAPVAAGRLDQP